MKKADGFIVVYDDEGGLVIPYVWDTECDGAICTYGEGIALFESRAAARKAISISRAYAALCKSQGRPVNTDFTTDLKYVRIRLVRKGGTA